MCLGSPRGLLHLCWQALPVCKAHPDSPGASKEQSLIWREGDCLFLRLQRRKNMQRGSGVLRRICCCKGGVPMCPVHTLWDKYFALLPDGAKPWAKVSAGLARERLRQILAKLLVPDWANYGTHDFRRGHAEVGSYVALSSVCCAVLQPLLSGYAEKRLHFGADPLGRPMEICIISDVPQ